MNYQGPKLLLKTQLKSRQFTGINSVPWTSLPLTNQPGLNKLQAESSPLNPPKHCVTKPSRFYFENRLIFLSSNTQKYPQGDLGVREWFTATLKDACGIFWALFPKMTRAQGHPSDSSAGASFQGATRALICIKPLPEMNSALLRLPAKHLAEFQIDNVSSQNWIQYKRADQGEGGAAPAQQAPGEARRCLHTLLFHCWGTLKSKNIKFQSDLISSLLGMMMTFSKVH